MAKKSKSKPSGPATIENRRARYDYEIASTLEAGIVLLGSEVKSIYAGRASLMDSFCRIYNGELWLYNMDIEPYSHAGAWRPERRRDRKLLMHRREIEQMRRQSEDKGFSLIPTRVYFKGRKVKVMVAVARGRKKHDKRESIKGKDEARAMRQGLDG
jgi:SsrA-binding protein